MHKGSGVSKENKLCGVKRRKIAVEIDLAKKDLSGIKSS